MESPGPSIDTLGYLLAALVFSVSLLITRTQEATTSALRDASEASWRIREVIGRGDAVSIRELSGALTLAREQRDWTREATRWVNVGLFASMCIVFIEGERLSGWGRAGSTEPALLALLLTVSAILVFVLAEFHNVYWGRRRREGIKTTLVGQLSVLEGLIAEDRVAAASTVVDKLAATYRKWRFLDEVRCRLLYMSGDDQATIDLGTKLLERDENSLTVILLVAAASVRSDEPQRALEIFESLEGYEDELAGIVLPIGLLAANLDCLVEPDPGLVRRRDDEDEGADVGLERIRFGSRPVQKSALELDWDDLEPLVFADSIYRAWHSDRELPTDLFERKEPLNLVTSSLTPEGVVIAPFKLLVESAVSEGSAYSLETAGVIALAAHVPTVAYDLLLEASRLRPASSRLHLLMAIAAVRMEWHDKAAAALSNSDQLGGLNVGVLQLAGWALTGVQVDENHLIPIFPRLQRNEDVLLAALMGYDATSQVGTESGATASSGFVMGLCRSSLVSPEVR